MLRHHLIFTQLLERGLKLSNFLGDLALILIVQKRENKYLNIPKDLDIPTKSGHIEIFTENLGKILTLLEMKDPKSEEYIKFLLKYCGILDNLNIEYVLNLTDSLALNFIAQNFTEFVKLFEGLIAVINEFNESETCKMIKSKTFTDFKSDGLSFVENVKKDLEMYLKIGRLVSNENDNETLGIIQVIRGLVSEFYDPVDKKYVYNDFPSTYAAIIGPSFMGKTQFAFTLACSNPVFYFNLISSTRTQNIYKAFSKISGSMRDYLEYDEQCLKHVNEGSEHFEEDIFDSIFLRKSNLSFKSVGFIWALIVQTLKYNWTNSEKEWLQFYLEIEMLTFESITLVDFSSRMSKKQQIISDLLLLIIITILVKLSKDLNFKPPIIFIDEYHPSKVNVIRFLRNLSRTMGISCVLSSTNGRISNMLNLNSISSGPEDFVWVRAITKLPKVRIETISEVVYVTPTETLSSFFFANQNVINVNKLLNALEITSTLQKQAELLKLWNILVHQSRTSLQGVALFSVTVFLQALKAGKGTELIVSKIWEIICSEIKKKIENRKIQAFENNGPFYSLRMISPKCSLQQKTVKDKGHDSIIINEAQVYSSIDEHFYYFGDPTDGNVTSFDFVRKRLRLNGIYYEVKSYFLPFELDMFTSFSLWHGISSISSVATIVSAYKKNLIDIMPNDQAMSNNWRAQEVVAYWSLASSSHQSFAGKTTGIKFFCNLIGNLQVHNSLYTNIKAKDEIDVEINYLDATIRKLSVFRPPFQVDIEKLDKEIRQCTKLRNILESQKLEMDLFNESLHIFPEDSVPTSLAEFFSDVIIPFLIPEGGSQNFPFFQNLIDGFCKIGICRPCPNSSQIDLSFDFYRNEILFTGFVFVECKYMDTEQKKDDVLIYHDRSKDKKVGITFFITYSLDDSLRSPLAWTIHVPSLTLRKKPKLENEFKLNVYSCFLDEVTESRIILPLREFKDPNGIFVILCCSKNLNLNNR